MANLLKGSEVANVMKENMITETSFLNEKGIIPGLAIVRVGSRPDDIAYERGAIKKCESVGVKCTVFEFPLEITQNDLKNEIQKLNENNLIHGILIFRPLPKQIDENIIKYVIDPKKDIDCFNPVNQAKVFASETDGYSPCTAKAVVEILKHYDIQLQGKKVAILGRSLVVGKPLSMLLLNENATVTICHSKTNNLPQVCRDADIVVAAIGRAKMVTDEYVSNGAVVIDVGINQDQDGNLCGDVDFEKVSNIASQITPVPGGVGVVTTYVLASHVINAAKEMSR